MKKNIIYRFLILSLLSVFALSSYGYAYQINGKVIDKETGKVLPGATVRVEGTGFGAITKSDGFFKIKNLKSGKYTLLISMIGYSSLKEDFVALQISSTWPHVFELVEAGIMTRSVVVSANKRIQSVQEVPISISVIDIRSLQDRGIARIDEALDYVPGVNLVGDQVSIRGSSGFAYGVGSRIALLTDGMPMLSGDQGDMKFDAVPVFDIQRIEIVKGAGSALYGTGALGGVINIITRDPSAEGKLRLRTSGGFYTEPRNEHEQWKWTDKTQMFGGFDAGYSRKFGDFAITLSGGMKEDQSYKRYDESSRMNLFSKMKYDFTDYTSLSLLTSFARDVHDDWVYWNSLDSALIPPTGTDESVYTESLKYMVSSELKHLFENGDFLIFRNGFYMTDYANSVEPDDVEYRASQAISINSEAQMNMRLWDENLLTYGLNFVMNSVDASIYGQHDQLIGSGYFQAEIEPIDKLTVTAGARFDAETINTDGNDAKGDDNFEFSPKLGLSYNDNLGISYRASAGRGFRAATVAEKFATINYGGLLIGANPELKPEVSASYEVGANKEFKLFDSRFFIDVAFFMNDFDNLIEPQFDEQGDIRFMNITKARIVGTEILLRTLLFNAIGLETSITMIDPQNLTLNETMKYRSKILWYSRLKLPYDPFEFNLDYRYMSRIKNVDIRLGTFIEDHEARVAAHILDARLIFKLHKISEYPLTLTLNVKNLLDYYYIEMVGNLAPVRSVSLQVDMDW
ncbi:MAG: TonB-dependent receptor [Chlorobi bacterium]|nr:TonB-dependent receptor [Chlorobiota bacterium]